MGSAILELVLAKLREAGIPADVAYPGQRCPVITAPVAAVHIEKVDRADLEVTVGIRIISPSSLGGSHCELAALRAAEVLRQAGAECVQNGCRYEGVAQVYEVSILAAFTCAADGDAYTLGPGFRVFVDGVQMGHAVSFRAEQTIKSQAHYEMGSDAPAGISGGSWIWEIRLEELIPTDSPEAAHPEGEFQLRLERDGMTETYSGCRWTSVRREFTRQGLRRIRTGICLTRGESIGE